MTTFRGLYHVRSSWLYNRTLLLFLLLPLMLAGGGIISRATDHWVQMVGNGSSIHDGFGSTSNVPDNKAVDLLRVFNGQLYAAVGRNETTNGNSLTVWRSSDLTNWSQVGVGAFTTNDLDCYSMETDGTRLFAGTHNASTTGANIYVTTNGNDWSMFNAPGVGFVRPGTIWASHMGILNSNLFAGTLTISNKGQVWKRPCDGSVNWVKVVDFGTGLGVTGGVPASNPNACYFYTISNICFMPAGNFLYQSSDANGTNWIKNTQAGDGFGDANNLNVSSLACFNGYLYAPTHNTTAGGQLWRTTITNALANGSVPWEKVVNNGFDQGADVSELHHITQGLGYIWISTQSSFAQVWRSADGTNWTRSNLIGFTTNNPTTSYKPMVETFNDWVVWGGASGTNATGAQVWILGPLVSNPSLQIQGTGPNKLISWPDGALDYNLETSTNLEGTPFWMSVTNSVVFSNNMKVVTFPATAPCGFYRLRQP